jgi:ATP-dependent helicase/nuclease subunit B
LPKSIQSLPQVAHLRRRWELFQAAVTQPQLQPKLVEYLYGSTLETSVSRLEEFAACPFRFSITSGLHAEERRLFQLDARHQGSFQHEVLARFHLEVQRENRRWRDLTAAEARQRIRAIAEKVVVEYEGGLLQASEQSRFTAEALISTLQAFITAAIDWMPQYQFDPHSVELAFGMEEKPLPAWEIDLGEGHRLSFRGKIDRVDLMRPPGHTEALCVVVDYKSSARRLDPILMAHGIQLQLLAYLNVLRSLEDPAPIFGVRQLLPTGVFFVNLRGKYRGAHNRTEVMESFQSARALAYQHTGRFDASALPHLDNRPGVSAGDQFNYRLSASGKIHGACREPLETAAFLAALDTVESHLRRMGREIYAGTVRVDPYRKGNLSACDQCEYRGICRIDPWTHRFRVLTAGRPAVDLPAPADLRSAGGRSADQLR